MSFTKQQQPPTPYTTAPIAGLRVTILPNDKGSPAGKLADAEISWTEDGPLQGLRLLGFALWERRSGNGRNVTFPARAYSINGERRSFALLRPLPTAEGKTQDAIRDLVLRAYREYETLAAVADGTSNAAAVAAAGTTADTL